MMDFLGVQEPRVRPTPLRGHDARRPGQQTERAGGRGPVRTRPGGALAAAAQGVSAARARSQFCGLHPRRGPRSPTLQTMAPVVSCALASDAASFGCGWARRHRIAVSRNSLDSMESPVVLAVRHCVYLGPEGTSSLQIAGLLWPILALTRSTTVHSGRHITLALEYPSPTTRNIQIVCEA